MIKIKRASKKDRDTLLLLRYLLHIYESNIEKTDKFNLKVMQQDKKIMLESLNNRKVFFFIAYYKNMPIGYSKIKVKIISNELVGHIGAIFVLEKFRKLGVGRKLFKAMVKVLRKNNIKKFSLEVWKSNKQGIRFYKKLGFNIIGDGFNSKVYRMEKLF